MPSPEHEALVLLFRNRPTLAAELARCHPAGTTKAAMRQRATRPGAVVGVVLLLCGCGGGEGEEAAFVPVEELPSCVPGAWINDTPTCFCGAEELDNPECEQEDCIFSAVLVLRSDGVVVQMDTRRSPSAGTVSVVQGCPTTVGEWTLEGDRLARGDRASPVQCSAEQLLVEDGVGYNRAPEDLASALFEIPDRESCVEIPYR